MCFRTVKMNERLGNLVTHLTVNHYDHYNECSPRLEDMEWLERTHGLSEEEYALCKPKSKAKGKESGTSTSSVAKTAPSRPKEKDPDDHLSLAMIYMPNVRIFSIRKVNNFSECLTKTTFPISGQLRHQRNLHTLAIDFDTGARSDDGETPRSETSNLSEVLINHPNLKHISLLQENEYARGARRDTRANATRLPPSFRARGK